MRFKNFKCEITLENATFADNGELSSILHGIADRALHGISELHLRDSNGNHVGYAKIYRKEVK
jgi:hypothetical protein